MNHRPVFMPPKPRRRRRRQSRAPAVTPTAPLALVAAEYEVGLSVTLTFNRAVDIENLDAEQITVFDRDFTSKRFQGVDAALLSPVQLEVTLEQYALYEGDGVLLNASAQTGIVAAVGGEAWEGVTDLALPYP